MKRIQMVLVLLVAGLLFSATGLAPCAYADDGGVILVPGYLVKSGTLEATTLGAPPEGDGSEGDPDSMGDGLSKDMADSGALLNGAEMLDGTDRAFGLEESLMLILSQIQLLLW